MPRPRSDIDRRIIEAARVCFLAAGVDGASLRQIARDADTNLGMIVYYFPTKDDLFAAVIEDVYGNLVAEMAQILGADAPVRERMHRAFVRLGAASEVELQVVRLIAREALSSSSRLRRILARFMRGHLPVLMATISEGIQNGEFDPTIPAPFILLAIIGLGPLPQMARLAARSLPLFATLPDTHELATLSVRILFRAVGATQETQSRSHKKRIGRGLKS